MTLDWGGKSASEKWAFERGGSKAAQGVDKTEKQDGNWKLEKIKTNKKINRIFSHSITLWYVKYWSFWKNSAQHWQIRLNKWASDKHFFLNTVSVFTFECFYNLFSSCEENEKFWFWFCPRQSQSVMWVKFLEAIVLMMASGECAVGCDDHITDIWPNFSAPPQANTNQCNVAPKLHHTLMAHRNVAHVRA